jgi:ligand-binding sensor domain-containing protein
MWFGTLDGLNKYDGYTFKLYKSNPYDKTTLSNNIVFKVFEDREKNLWIGTLGGGLNKFDRQREKFTQYRFSKSDTTSISDDNVRSIYQDLSGRIWVGTNNGLNLFNTKAGTFQRFYSGSKKNSLSNNFVWSIYESAFMPGVLWIGTYNGLNRYDTKEKTFRHFKNVNNNKTSLSNNYAWTITGVNYHLYIGTNKGLNKFNIKTEKVEEVYYNSPNNKSLGSDKVWALITDNENHLLVGTLGGGLSISENSANSNSPLIFKRFQKNSLVQSSLSHNDVWSIYIDRTGVLWIATELGINKYDSEKEKFSLVKNDPFNNNSLTYNEVTAIYKEPKGNLWIGTRKGLNNLDISTGQITRIGEEGKKNYGLTNGYIRSIYRTQSGKVLVGTNGGGLFQYNSNSKTFQRFIDVKSKAKLSSENLTSIYEDSNGVLWIGTLGGINRYNPSTGEVKVYSKNQNSTQSISHDYVYTIYQTSDNKIWIGTLGGGLNCFDPANESFVHYFENQNDFSAISNNTIWAIYEDKKKNLWIGTNNGLNKFDRIRGVFEFYDESKGLYKNAIYGILEDELGRLWLSSNNGIIKYDHEKKNARNYSNGYGLQSKQFTGNAYFQDENGIMYFGGINGLNYFNPSLIQDNKHIPEVVLTDFQIFNQSVPIGNDSYLKKSISETKEIELPSSQNVFSFEYAALHYSSPQLNQYAYKMEGFDKDWIKAGTRRFVTYTNLDPGEYAFRVIGSNNDDVWNTVGTSVIIKILPPFWKTWWFISVSILFLMGLVGTILYFRLKHLLEIERLRVKISADLHDDIGTRLTEISLLTDILYHTEDSNDSINAKESIRTIGGIARSLIENMSDIVWLINPKRDSLYELFLKLRDGYEEILSHFHIVFHINNLEFIEKIRLPMDYRKNVYLIFKEAINNTIKYSSCSEISLNADVRGRQLTITMYDNGIGFDVNKKTLGNGLFNMQKRAKNVGGKLRIQSKLGDGTMIQFTGRI